MSLLRNKNHVSIKKRFIPFIILTFYFAACNSVPEVDLTKRKTNFPDRTLINAHIYYKDSGRIVLDLRSPLIEEYSMIDTPYMKFPKGLELDFYNKKSDTPGYLRANWATASEMRGWYEGRGDVLVINEKGDTLKTQKLFWNKKTRKIFTQDTVFLISKMGDSLQANNGLEATDDLKEYTLFNNQGTKYYEEKE
ncbi:LPS export ABC transporter periplasmic protein LptC [Moheibacter sediminis]|uniref:LPS export ABC transporter protein LptC n=1 Tax=Moheibacter sediminis TaxID=1434700 RepID=A0A1W2CB09_9FLAO|nr:LPS export ABC transporter protein LptC [Moheibacter sediminis]